MHRNSACPGGTRPASALVPLALSLLAACGPGTEVAPAGDDSLRASPAGVTPTQTVSTVPDCAATGLLRGRIVGAVESSIDWHGAGLDCEGMQRPADAGARLRFAGNAGNSRPLAFIIALPELERGATVRETPATVTLIDELSGRFYSNADMDSCWSDVARHAALGDSHYAIDGIVYCVAPLAEVNGDGSVSFSEFAYSGHIDWAHD